MARHCEDPALLTAGAWLELLDGLSRLGLEVPASATSTHVAAQVASVFGSDVAPTARLVGALADQALYCAEWPVDETRAQLAWTSQAELYRSLRRRVGRRERARSLVRVGQRARPPHHSWAQCWPSKGPRQLTAPEAGAVRGRRPASNPASGTLPGYTNIAEIATGSFATVYRAVELGTGRAVALKVLRVADTSPHMVEAFKKELGALALLSNHPNVTTLYRTFFTPEGRPVLVLELCRESLAQRVRRSGPMPAQEVAQVGVKVAGALETAHRSGLLHRDMKPQNILVSQFGEPVLADFGVVALQVSAQSTEGVFGFTTLHAPPEALEGLHLSPAADIYGLASTMYQLLLGRALLPPTRARHRRPSSCVSCATQRPGHPSRPYRSVWPISSKPRWPRTPHSGLRLRALLPNRSARSKWPLVGHRRPMWCGAPPDPSPAHVAHRRRTRHRPRGGLTGTPRPNRRPLSPPSGPPPRRGWRPVSEPRPAPPRRSPARRHRAATPVPTRQRP